MQNGSVNSTGERDRAIVERREKRILVVEDDRALSGMISAALRRRGFGVCVAGDGSEAERAIIVRRPHLVLLDLNMPGIDGWSFLERTRASRLVEGIPVVVISAHLRSAPAAILALGAAAILPKPFDLNELLDVVDHLVP